VMWTLLQVLTLVFLAAPTSAPGLNHQRHASAKFPNPSNTGVPAHWRPARVRTTDLRVTKPGTVVENILLKNADLLVDAPNVTIRRVELLGGQINNVPSSTCRNGTVIENSTIGPPPGESSSADTEGVISYGGYTARGVKIWRRSEGFRDGGMSEGCGPVRIVNSFAKIVIPPGRCDLHADGIQGYDGPPLTVRNTTVDFYQADCGTAPFFVPSGQGNTRATVHRLLVMGGGYPFRLGVRGDVSGLRIVNHSWGYGPVDIKCSVMSHWNASIVQLARNYRTARTVRPQRCRGTGS
jgi:hypothetical protein